MGYSMDLLEDIYDQCLSKPEAERESFIRLACKDNEDLRNTLTQMLANSEHSVRYFQVLQQTIMGGLVPDLRPVLDAGEIVGNYRIVRLLGKGGMSNVYLAERSDGEFEQQIAIKCFLNAEVGGDSQLAKKGEQQLLAKLEHPNIATILDAGVTEKGILYFMMKYIDGDPIDVFVKKADFNLNKKLSLFMQVIDSVAYAHSRLILHLDIKPSNILVNKEGKISLLDFGIATTFESKGNGFFLGTPAIAAPEQLKGEAVSAATDVYQLGILLHQLVVGREPIADVTNEINELTRRELPATVTKKVISDEIDFELTAIIKGCLAEKQDDRYQSAASLWQDIQNYTLGYPINALKRGSGYRTLKYFKRNKVAVGSVVLIFFSLLIGTAVSLWQAGVAKTQRDLALKNEKVATSTKDFLIDLFMEANPSNAKGDTMTVYQFLDKAYEKVDSYKGSAEIKFEMLTTLGRSYRSLGDFKKSKVALNKAHRLSRDSLLEISSAYIRGIEQLALYQRDIGHYDSARMLLKEVLSMYASIDYPEVDSFYTTSLKYLSYIYKTEQKLDSAKQMIEKAIRLEEQLWPDHNNINLAESYYLLGAMYKDEGQFEKAIVYQTMSLDLCESLMGEYYPGTLANLNVLSAIMAQAGKLREALSKSIRAKDIAIKLYGEAHHETATIIDNLGVAYFGLAEYDSAYYYFRKALFIRKKLYTTDENIRTQSSYNNLLSLFVKTEKRDSAGLYLADALRVSASSKTNARQRSSTYKWAGAYYEMLPDYRLAKEFYLKSLAEYQSFLPLDNQQVIQAQETVTTIDSLLHLPKL